MSLVPSRFGALYLVAVASAGGMLSAQVPPADPCPPAAAHMLIESGSISPQPGVTFQLRHFSATLVSRARIAPGCYEKMTVVAHARIFVSNASLTQQFAARLGATDSKIKGFKIENGQGTVTLSGHITKVMPIQFSVTGPVTTDGTVLLLDAKEIKADGIPVKALLALVGEHLGSVIGMKGMRGISVNENTMTFSPEDIAHIKGYIERVETTPEGLTLHYGRPPAVARLAKTTLPPSH